MKNAYLNPERWLVLVTFASLLMACSGPQTRPDTSQISPALVARGVALREAIDDRSKNTPPSARRRWGTDMRDVVVRFIPVGSDFDEGLQVLTAAGFTVGQRQDATRYRPAMQSAVIDPYIPCLLCNVSAYVQLRTDSSGQWRRIDDVVGEISALFP